MNIKSYELDELVLRAYGYSGEEIDEKLADYFDADYFLTDKLEKMDGVLNFVHDLVSRLMPFCFSAQSALTKKLMCGFGVTKEGIITAIAHMPHENE
jgi:hypothetical protein